MKGNHLMRLFLVPQRRCGYNTAQNKGLGKWGSAETAVQFITCFLQRQRTGLKRFRPPFQAALNKRFLPIRRIGLNDRIELNGVSLYVQSEGEGSTVVLLHGMPLDHRMWDEIFAVLRPHYHTVRYDLRGAGRSGDGEGPFAHHRLTRTPRGIGSGPRIPRRDLGRWQNRDRLRLAVSGYGAELGVDQSGSERLSLVGSISCERGS
jgi:hypothetical protein